MSTRSCIILKLKESDINTKKKFSSKKLPKGIKLQGWDCYHETNGKELSKEVSLVNPYIGIYCHSDGYPSGVGRVLKEKFNNYEDVLNLIVGGHCSVVWFDMVRRYGNRKNEEWEWLEPKQGTTPNKVATQTDHAYAYLFENGEWKMKHWDDKDFHEYDENED